MAESKQVEMRITGEAIHEIDRLIDRFHEAVWDRAEKNAAARGEPNLVTAEDVKQIEFSLNGG